LQHSQKLTAFWASPKTKSAGGSSPPTKIRSACKTATLDSPHFSVGIDPGYGETGVVLVEHSEYTDSLIEYGLVRDHFGSSFPTVFRSQAVAVRVIERLLEWVHKHHIRFLDIAIEMPIYNLNVDAFAKQSTLIQAIEALICSHVAPLVERCWIVEPSPSESKHLATGSGSATKAEVFRASPYSRPQFKSVREALGESSVETLADAWAHSLATRGRTERRFDTRMMEWPEPQRRNEDNDST